MSEPVNPLDALMAAHERLGLPGIGKMPGKRWEGKVGPWRFIVNAARVPVMTDEGVSVPAFHAYVEYNGWPAGVLDLMGNGQFAAGTEANLERFAAALAEWDGR